MKLVVAGVTKEYEEGLNVAQLVERENVEMPLYVSISLNDEFVDNEKREETILHDGDQVEFLYFMGGGC